jgi:hypothetical protein
MSKKITLLEYPLSKQVVVGYLVKISPIMIPKSNCKPIPLAIA